LNPESTLDSELLREVSNAEEQRTRQANALLTRLASAAPYARLVELYEELEEAFGREASAVRRAAEMNRAARALGNVASELAADLRRHVHDDFGIGSEQARQLEAAIAEETQRAPFELLVTLRSLEQGPFEATEDGICNDAEAVETLAAELPQVGASTDLVGAIRSGVLVAQRLVGRQLQIYEERINEASLYLRQLAAEVSDGAPALMRTDGFDPDHGETNLGRTTFDPLALDKALYLHRALRHARRLLDVTDHADERAADTAEESDNAEERTAPEDETPDHPEAGPPGLTENAGEQGLADPSDAPEPPPGGREDQVLDLRALAEHATGFTDELEKAWSAALDDALWAEAQRELAARYASLLHSIQRRVAAGDRALRAAGVDPVVPAYPLPGEELARLSLEPNEERRWRQLQLAELEALMLLLQAIQAMRAPSAQTIHFDEQRVETWWEAGSFSLVRDRVALLVRISEQAGRAEAVVAGGSIELASPPTFFDRLRLASGALSHGDVEAALIHARHALRLRAALEVDAVPTDLLQRLASDSRLSDEAHLLRLLDEAATRIAAGEPLDVAATILIAPRALAVVGRLCLETSQIIIEAVEGETSGSGS
jgi:hypothetical protein